MGRECRCSGESNPVLLQIDLGDVDHEGRHVVRGAPGESLSHELARQFLGGAGGPHDAPECVEIQCGRQAITAEQEAVACYERKRSHAHPELVARSERTDDGVSRDGGEDVVGEVGFLLEHVSGHRVVDGQKLEPSVASAVDAAVADGGQMDVVGPW